MRIPRKKKKEVKKRYNLLRVKDGLKPHRKLIALNPDGDGVWVIPKKEYLYLKMCRELNF
jgi:hypothetical protein